MKHELFQGEAFLNALKAKYEVTENDCREFSSFSKKGLHFQAKSYEFGNIGHYCILTMSGMRSSSPFTERTFPFSTSIPSLFSSSAPSLWNSTIRA